MSNDTDTMLAKARLYFTLNPIAKDKWERKVFKYCQFCIDKGDVKKGCCPIKDLKRWRTNIKLTVVIHKEYCEEFKFAFWPCLEWIKYV